MTSSKAETTGLSESGGESCHVFISKETQRGGMAHKTQSLFIFSGTGWEKVEKVSPLVLPRVRS